MSKYPNKNRNPRHSFYIRIRHFFSDVNYFFTVYNCMITIYINNDWLFVILIYIFVGLSKYPNRNRNPRHLFYIRIWQDRYPYRILETWLWTRAWRLKSGFGTYVYSSRTCTCKSPCSKRCFEYGGEFSTYVYSSRTCTCKGPRSKQCFKYGGKKKYYIYTWRKISDDRRLIWHGV
jgi:hypothetical protein